MPKRATHSGERTAKKAAKDSPPTTSPLDESKKFEEELAKAMDLSQKEMKKGDEEELMLLKKVLKESLHDEIKKSLERTSTSEQPKELTK